MNLVELAMKNKKLLGNNPYPGRGIVMGYDEKGDMTQIYWIMGRSDNSRNRVFVLDQEAGRVSTEAANASKVTDPSLIIYDAMLEGEDNLRTRKYYMVSNGHQTKKVLQDLRGQHSQMTFESALQWWEYEPDAPNFTPRITGLAMKHEATFHLSVIRKCDWSGERERNTYEYQYSPHARGFGMCVTTYKGDGNPLPSFDGKPFLLPLLGNVDEICETYWHTLDDENKVSLAVKVIDSFTGISTTRIKNKFAQT